MCLMMRPPPRATPYPTLFPYTAHVRSPGYSHPVPFAIPEGIQITVEKQTRLVVSGADRAQVGQVAANIRGLRPPDPYKQKGIRLVGERLKKKAGKAGAAKTAA